MNFKNKWVIIAIAIVVLAIIIMISRQPAEPIPAPETTTTTEEVVIEPVDVLPVEGEVAPAGDFIIDDTVIIE